MAKFLQDALGIEPVTARFMLVYFGAFIAVLMASAIYEKIVPARLDRQDSVPRKSESQAQRTGKNILRASIGWLASKPISPNQVTLIGLGLVVFNCAYFVRYEDTFLFGAGLIAAFLFDTLDGAIARAQGSSSKFGAYLDAVVDRYQEIATYLVIGVVTNMWLAAFLVITGSMLTSYNKARAAIEIPVDNKGWPDLLGKGTRLFLLCAALIGDPTYPGLLAFGLYALAVMTHFTAIQRIVRGYVLIRSEDAVAMRQDAGAAANDG